MTWRVLDSAMNRTFNSLVVGDIGVPAGQIGFCNFTVPAGRIAILRGFEYAFDPVFNLTVNDEFFTGAYTTSLNVGPPTVVTPPIIIQQRGTAQPGYSRLRLGQRCTRQPTYIIADENETISLIVETTVLSPVVHSQFRSIMYGNLLLKSGQPITFEPGTSARLLRSLSGSTL